MTVDPNNPTPEVNPAPATPPVTNGDSGKTYSQDDVDRKLQGSGKRIKELEDALKAKQDAEEMARQKALEDQGKFKELHDASQTELQAARERLEELEGEKTARLEVLEAENKKRIKALPDNLRKLVPAGLPPDQAALQITEVEGLIVEKVITVYGGQPTGGGDPEDFDAANAAKGDAFIKGDK